MKKIISIVLLCTMLLACFAGCGAKQGQMDLGSYAGEVAVDSLSGEGTPDRGITGQLKENVKAFKVDKTLDIATFSLYTGEPDTKWYDDIENKDDAHEVTLDTADEFVGFLKLMDDGVTFGTNTDVDPAEDTKDYVLTEQWTITLTTHVNLNGAELSGVCSKDSNKVFNGIFDGGHHIITNYVMNPSGKNTGLFGVVQGDYHGVAAQIKNFALINVTCNLKYAYIASVAYQLQNEAVMENVYSDATMQWVKAVALTRIGGLVANVNGSGEKRVTNCEYAAETIDLTKNTTKETRYNAGMIGTITGGSVSFSNCVNRASIDLTGAKNSEHFGGYVGYSSTAGSVSFENCLNSGNMTGDGAYIGGFIGRAKKANPTSCRYTFVNCENTGNITGSNEVGGFAGTILLTKEIDEEKNIDKTASEATADGLLVRVVSMTNCTSSGNVTATAATGVAGGLIGYAYALLVEFNTCTFSGTLTATGVAGGLVGKLLPAGTGSIDSPSARHINCTVPGGVKLCGERGVKLGIIGCQTTEVVDGKYDLRIVASVNDLAELAGLGFAVEINTEQDNARNPHELAQPEVYVSTVYKSIKGGAKIYTAEEFFADYLFTLEITGIPADYTLNFTADEMDSDVLESNLEIYVTPFTAVRNGEEIVKTGTDLVKKLGHIVVGSAS